MREVVKFVAMYSHGNAYTDDDASLQNMYSVGRGQTLAKVVPGSDAIDALAVGDRV
jgi:hypothetical protein